ncbi:DUF6115 domain-containing protein [Metabacillus idriensis]|uniref:DUF6115 domain-containing protein n=1 Tax=Metabacillus idriensis TaxID=324768 RepID=UPI003D265F46
MTVVLLIISMILHAAGFYFIALLYLKYQSVKQSEEKQAAILEEAEQSLAAYMIEFKEENEKLIAGIKMAKQTDINIGRNSSHPHKPVTEPEEPEFPVVRIAHEDQLELSDPIEKVQPESEEKKIISLFQQGLSSEEIAKKLNKGKTEVELLLKFRQN